MEDNEFIIMRHSYDDHSYIDGKNDASLTTNGIEIARNAAEHILFKLNDRELIIRYSIKKRAIETTEILCERFYKSGIKYKCIEDNGLIELYQGEFNFQGMEHTDKINFLQSCWDDFERERKQGNLKHCFGENKDRNIVLRSGENHTEWSARVGGAVLNILDDMQKNAQLINITHRGAMLEIQKIIDMANGKISINQVEKYETVGMKYCQDSLLQVDNLNCAKERTQKFIEERCLK